MTKNRYDFAIFDVDGTVLDTSEGILSAVEYTIKKCGLKQVDRSTLLKFIGPPIQDSFRDVYSLEGDILQELATIFRERYKEADLLKAKPYPHIYEVLDFLSERGVKSAAATYKRQDYAEKIIKHFGFDKYFSVVYGADHENRLKKTDLIRNCLVDMDVYDYKHVVMIGDSSLDAVGAKMNGIDFIGVTYGFDFKSKKDIEECYSTGYADSANEIIKYFTMENQQ